MPIYEYECTNCGTRFDLRRAMAERDESPDCPECGGASDRILSLPASIHVEGGATHSGRDIFPDVQGEPDW